MSHIKVDFDLMQDIENILSVASTHITEAGKDFMGSVSFLDWNIKSKDRIEYRSKQLVFKLSDLSQCLNSYNQFIYKCCYQYKSIEKKQIIYEYEKKHPGAQEKVDKILNSGGKKNDLSPEEKAEIKYKIYKAAERDERATAILLANAKYIKLGNTDASSESIFLLRGTQYVQYQHRIFIDRKDDKNSIANEVYQYDFPEDDRYYYTNLIHESGHAIADRANIEVWLGYDTSKYKAYVESTDKEMTIREAILYDVYDNPDNEYSLINLYKLCNMDITFDEFKKNFKNGKYNKEVYQTFLYGENFSDQPAEYKYSLSAVSDIYGGATNNYGVLNRGHSVYYWAKDKNNLPNEAWANYFQGFFIEDEAYMNNIRNYLPTASIVLDSYVDDLYRKATNGK